MRAEPSISQAFDVVVVGAGAAGLAAAVAAAQAGASVLVLEKLDGLHGTTSWSVGSMAAAGTRLQRRQGVEDSVEAFAEDIAKTHPKAAEPAALRMLLAREAGPTLAWLERLGVVFVGPFPEPPNRVPRMHNVLPAGFAFLDVLQASARRLGVGLRFGCRVAELRREDGRVTGLRYEQAGLVHEVSARRAVVLASGDFSGSAQMRSRHLSPAAAAGVPINRHSTGDGHRMGQAQGAVATEMGAIFGPQLRFPAPAARPWLHRLPSWRWLRHLSAAFVSQAPRAWVAPFVRQLLVAHMSPSEALMSGGALLVDQQGVRVEAGEQTLAEALALRPGSSGFVIGDEALARRFSAYPSFISTAPGIAYAYFADYERGRPDLVRWADGAAALAHAIGLPQAALERSVAGLSGRLFALGPILAMLTVTEGGLAIDDTCRVLDIRALPITGLYAAGGVGQGGLLLKGHGLHLSWALASGRVAGEQAARALPGVAAVRAREVA